MIILVSGCRGQLGYDVVRVGHTYDNLEMVGLSSNELDITKEQDVYQIVNHICPDAIIHCAAYTAVDKAEVEKDVCWNVNVEGTRYLARAAKNIGAKFMYISTDYVFDGEGNAPFVESDFPNPIGYYGLTKYEGEKVIQSLLEKWFIVRISWVFGSNGKNFVKTMLRLSETNKVVKVVDDQYGSPTYTMDVANLLISMIQTEKYGIYHATNEGFCSWADFAQEIFRQASRNVIVDKITSEEYPTIAKRPKNSRMSKDKLVEYGFSKLPSWQNALARYLKEIGEVH